MAQHYWFFDNDTTNGAYRFREERFIGRTGNDKIVALDELRSILSNGGEVLPSQTVELLRPGVRSN